MLNMTYEAHELLWVVTGVRFRKEITRLGDESPWDSSTRSALQHSPQRLMSVILVKLGEVSMVSRAVFW